MSDEERVEDASTSTSAATAAMANVSVKLPPFWPSDPEVWFAQVEAHFSTQRITAQKTHFDYVIASLSPEVATEVRDLILKPPEDTPYSVLKEQLIKRTAASEQRRLQQLFHTKELCNSYSITAGITDITFLQELFLQCLPSNVRMVIVSTSAITNLEELVPTRLQR